MWRGSTSLESWKYVQCHVSSLDRLVFYGPFRLILVMMDLNIALVIDKLATNFPRKTVSVYVMIVGLVLLIQYLSEIIAAYTTGKPPSSLDHYTTLELASLEMGIMIPLHLISGVLLWRKKAWGYVISTTLVFISSVVFIALSISLLLFYFWIWTWEFN